MRFATPFLVALLGLATACGARSRSVASPASDASATRSDRDVDEAGKRADAVDRGAADATDEPGADARARDVIELEPIRLEVIRDEATGEATVTAFDARTLFDEGNEALVGGDHALALARYDQLVADFPDSKLVGPTLYNAGLALEGQGDFDGAVARYRELVRRQPTGRDSIDAHIRAAAVLAELERWRDAVSVLDEVLARPDLGPSDTLEVRARRGYVLLEARDLPAAEAELAAAIRFYDDTKAVGTRFETDYFIAMARYYFGEVPRRQFAAIPIRLPDEQVARDVEAKAELVLLAGERFGATIEVGNVYWATAAGFQLAAMQHEFWTAVVTAPVPPQLDARAAEVYVTEVHREVENLLARALAIHEKNVKLAEVYETSTRWSEASARQVGELAMLLARERAGDLVTPTAPPTSVAPPGPSAPYTPSRYEL